MVILSDLSEVLIHGIDGIEKIVHRDYGVDATNKVFTHLVLNYDTLFCDLLRGKMTEDEFWCKFLEYGEWPFSVDDAKRMLSENLAREPLSTVDVYHRITIYPERIGYDARPIHGRPDIYIVSDHIAERIDEVKNLHKDVFDITARQYWSCCMGMVKKDSKFFPTLLEEIKKKPSEVIFIDNNAENVAAAERAGITGIRFETPNKLVRQLGKYGFKIA